MKSQYEYSSLTICSDDDIQKELIKFIIDESDSGWDVHTIIKDDDCNYTILFYRPRQSEDDIELNSIEHPDNSEELTLALCDYLWQTEIKDSERLDPMQSVCLAGSWVGCKNKDTLYVILPKENKCYASRFLEEDFNHRLKRLVREVFGENYNLVIQLDGVGRPINESAK